MNRGPWLACSWLAFRPARRALHHGAWLSPSRRRRSLLPACRCPISAETPIVPLPLTCRCELRRLAAACSLQPSGILQDRSRTCRFSCVAASDVASYVYDHSAGAKSAGCFLAKSLPLGAAFSRPTLLGLSATTAPVPASHFPAGIAPCTVACTRRCCLEI